MPSSDIEQIPKVLRAVMSYNPASVLDIGPGFGKWGFLLREHLEGETAGPIAAVDRAKRKLRIDAVEIFPDYITELHRLLYDRITLGDISELCSTLDEYDVILMVDVIEHLPREVAVSTVNCLLSKARKGVIVATPNGTYPQGEIQGNIHERHVDAWTARELREEFQAQVLVTGNQLLACISRGGATNEWMAGQIRSLTLAARAGRVLRKVRRIPGAILRRLTSC